MRFEDKLTHLLLALAALLGLLSLLVVGQLQDVKDQGPDSARGRFTLPKQLFDFEQYKRLFKKTYGSLAEELARRKLMLARAFRAWISSIKYRTRKSSYYLALNHMSDWTPEELDRMENKAGEDSFAAAAAVGEEDSSIPDVDPENVEQDLQRLLAVELVQEKLDSQPEAQPLGRRKRETDGDPEETTRVLPLDRLINTPGDGEDQLGPGASQGNAPAPRHLDRDSGSMSMDSKLEEIQFVELGDVPLAQAEVANSTAKGARSSGRLSSLMRAAKSRLSPGGGAKRRPVPGDAVHFDHRDSGCLMLPRHQGQCGSCWAFTAVAFAEWLHCRITGRLVAFSEQYLVDCGHLVGASGCGGGSERASVKFVHNFGLELRDSYPYLARENQCPHEVAALRAPSPKRTGHVRMELGALLAIPVSSFEQYIEFAPIVVSIQLKRFPGIHEYGGGVMGGRNCVQRGSHSILLVGHGREDNQEYWLARNSWSTSWGEAGHFKLAKACAGGCLENGQGLLYGTRDGRQFVAASPN